jgi:hypothetical protein
MKYLIALFLVGCASNENQKLNYAERRLDAINDSLVRSEVQVKVLAEEMCVFCESDIGPAVVKCDSSGCHLGGVMCCASKYP